VKGVRHEESFEPFKRPLEARTSVPRARLKIDNTGVAIVELNPNLVAFFVFRACDFQHGIRYIPRFIQIAATITAEACPCGVTFELMKLAPGRASPLRTAATGHSGRASRS